MKIKKKYIVHLYDNLQKVVNCMSHNLLSWTGLSLMSRMMHMGHMLIFTTKLMVISCMLKQTRMKETVVIKKTWKKLNYMNFLQIFFNTFLSVYKILFLLKLILGRLKRNAWLITFWLVLGISFLKIMSMGWLFHSKNIFKMLKIIILRREFLIMIKALVNFLNCTKL